MYLVTPHLILSILDIAMVELEPPHLLITLKGGVQRVLSTADDDTARSTFQMIREALTPTPAPKDAVMHD